jgi:hypothetical protein
MFIANESRSPLWSGHGPRRSALVPRRSGKRTEQYASTSERENEDATLAPLRNRGLARAICRPLEAPLEVGSYVVRSISYERAKFDVRTALFEKPIATHTGNAALCDAGILAFREQRF